jgi:hypothetical protein
MLPAGLYNSVRLSAISLACQVITLIASKISRKSGDASGVQEEELLLLIAERRCLYGIVITIFFLA